MDSREDNEIKAAIVRGVLPWVRQRWPDCQMVFLADGHPLKTPRPTFPVERVTEVASRLGIKCVSYDINHPLHDLPRDSAVLVSTV